jgi:hypothetical protein
MFIELCGWVRLNHILSYVAASGYTAYVDLEPQPLEYHQVTH